MKQTAKKNQSTSSSSSSSSQSNGKQSGNLLEKFFHDQLMDIYYAEQQLSKGLQELKEASTTEELEDAFEDHRQQTQRHIQRLEKVFDMLGIPAKGKQCKAIEGIIAEAKEIIKETKKGTMTRDAALIIAAQKAEHYEIATYGGLVQLAITLGKRKAADLLQKTLQEEEDTDSLLTEIAESYINIEADNEDETEMAGSAMASSF